MPLIIPDFGSTRLVLRPARSYRTYTLHPYIADYQTVEDLEAAIQDAAERIAAGELNEPSAYRYDTPVGNG